MQIIKEKSPSGLLKASDSDIKEIEDIFSTFSSIIGPYEALQKLYNYFHIRWRKTLIESWAYRNNIKLKDEPNIEWFITLQTEKTVEKNYIKLIHINFITVMQQTEIPALKYLEEAKEKAFIPDSNLLI